MTAPIEFDAVVKKFGKRTVLDQLNFEVPEGKVVGLLGPNGAGKSTAMRVLLGLHSATSGSARVLGKRYGERGFREAVRQVGTIIEAPPVYKRATPMQNLKIRVAATGMSLKDSEIRSVINRVGLAERVDDPVGDFSLGMRQRVGLALATVGHPNIVVLDEPTNGLDPEGSFEVRQLISDLPSQGATALVCTHRLAEIEQTCDYVVLLQQGRLITQGTLDEIRAQSGVAGHRVLVEQAEIAATASVLQALGLGDVHVIDGTVTTSESDPHPSRITRALADAGIYVNGLETRTATLEEAFLAITGGVHPGGQS